jgi:SAM-dependent methyltransferase
MNQKSELFDVRWGTISIERRSTMSIMSKILKQCRKPTGWLGRSVAWGMNISHSKMTAWGLSYISIGQQDTILDIGCGGGGTLRKLAGTALEGRIYGIDYSEDSVRVSRNTNKRAIEAGRVEIRQGSVSSLPFPEDMFDLITAVESHYFWPDLLNDMKEVLRVLKPGGTLIMIGGEYKGGKYDERNQKWVEPGDMAYHSVDEFEELFSHVGYTEVQVLEHYNRGWMCGMGIKPTQSLDKQS